MSIWVRSILTQPVSVTVDVLTVAVQDRLELLTYLFCPEEEEEPEDVLARLAIDNPEPGVFLIRYRADSEHFIRMDAVSDLDAAREECGELAETLEGLGGEGVGVVSAVLASAVQTAALALTVGDARSMGWPLAIAIAAELAARGRGLIQADGAGWMEPSGPEVRYVLEDER